MSESGWSTSAAMLFERNDAQVLEAFRRGEFDDVDAIGEVSAADFFRVITERKILDQLAQSYPSPRERHDVPLWVHAASNLSMRFDGQHHFHAFPFLVRCSSIVEAFAPAMGHQTTRPETGDISLRRAGFNERNDYNRQTPSDQEYLRKLAGDTDALLLQAWFNREVVGIFKQHHAFDAQGIFIGDASYLFVPDNERYQGSSRLLFDEQNHPVDPAKLTPEQQQAYCWRRCYKLVTLLHTNRAGEFFLYGGLRLTAGKDHEAPVLYELLDEFVQCHGRGVMKRLLVDRDFLDGEKIGHCKRDLGIDVVLLDSAAISEPLATREEYGLRTSIEERHRQLKCFTDLAGFTSRKLSLVVNQVVFVLLMHSLLEWYWQQTWRPEFNPRTTARALDELRPTMTVILIFYQGYVARLAPLEYQELLLTLAEEARQKIMAKTGRLRRGLTHQLDP